MPRFSLNDLPFAVDFDNAGEVARTLGAITRGWRLTAGATTPAALSVSGAPGVYRLASDHRDGALVERTTVSAACSLVVDVAERMARDRADMLCLHAGAVHLPGDGGLIVFPSRRRAGKSTLVARLASLGAEVFADDILPVIAADGALRACALGVASRLRLPLPTGLPGDFLAWCSERRGPEDAWYRYLAPQPGELAPWGGQAPLRAFVFLDRVDGDAPATLARVARPEALQALLLQNFGVAAGAGALFDRFVRLLDLCGVYALRYGALDPAARLLLDAFAGDPSACCDGWASLPPPAAETARTGAPEPDRALARAAGVVETDVDGRPFLLDEANGAVFALDGVGGLVWALLKEPATTAEIVDALAEVYADIPAERLDADAAAFLAALQDRGLVTAAGDR